ncbi:LCP family protein [Bifidobacterium sp. LC6]|uniref:LCP family protein n=1 Tax=Bifidobacterium colobi TaxID=2809026 RepID=A0ABS5UV15_9BIFI|nr:LCP family protein [Bifidobacterium colobi]MBT1174850.1 LCP family protein [Bifidobacterium colobi]
MAQEPSEADQQINPPSFTPPAGRRTRPSGPIPRSSGSSSSASQYQPSRTFDHADQAVPASFAPPASRRASQQRSSAPSFSPRTSRKQTPATPTAGAGSDVPQSIPPARARRSTGSSRNVVRPATSSLVGTNGNQSLNSLANSRFAAHGSGSAQLAQSLPHTHRIRKIVISFIAALLAAAVIAVYCAWGWVDSRLNKTDWLTDTANTSAATWLILGSDERDEPSDITGFRTDTILVLTKPKSGPSSLISIPRDSLMNVDGQYMKINAVAQTLGRKALVQQVENITGQKIDHVAQIKFGGLQQIVDALGGIRLCYDEDVQDAYSGLNWQSGCHDADGATALAFSRMRYSDANGDFGRNERQRQVIAAVIQKASSKETLTNPKKVLTVAESGLAALTVDEDASPMSLMSMALAFKDATGSKGVSGSVYWSDADYYVDGVGSSVLLDDQKNSELFAQLAQGTHAAGTVGTLAEAQS